MSQYQTLMEKLNPLPLSRMKRRHFIKQSTIAAAGGFLIHHLPLQAGPSMFQSSQRHVVICVIAGLAKPDFENLFASKGKQSISGKRLIYGDLNYRGAAAGHRIALESILYGKYIEESQSGKLPLAQSPLFDELHPSDKKYLVTSDRDFLNASGYAENRNDGAIHLRTSCSPNQEGNPLVRGAKSSFSLVASNHRDMETASTLRNEIIGRNDSYHRRLLFYSEDLLVAETACTVLRNETPTLLVTHFMGADVAHGDVSQAKTNIQHIGTGIRRVWETVNNHPEMKDNTLLVVLPDFGRNGAHNSISDENGNYGTDHSIFDENTTNIACLFATNVLDFQLSVTPKTTPMESTDISWIVRQFLGGKNHFSFSKKDLLEQA
jgi:hypothetical protein